MKQYLFAYGTLAEDNVPREIAAAVKQLTIVGAGFIFACLYDLGEYPGAVLDERQRYKVFGKIFELPADRNLLDRLDAYEGFDPERPAASLFVRKCTAINRPRQAPVTGWVYEYNGDVHASSLIKSGHYSKVSV
jgi:gamma-glutamylcyclotransferase (GGCT)/AIG2-like uncharacterized protein YtfP